jgi:two-component system, cell cycle sensor histidine kinase and response regulator CckA
VRRYTDQLKRAFTIAVALSMTEWSSARRGTNGTSALFRAIAEQAPTFFALTRGDNHVFEIANDAFLRLIRRSDVVGRPIGEAVPELLHQGLIERFNRVLRDGEPFAANDMPLLISHETRFVSFVCVPLTDENGVRVGVLTNGYDVTEQVLSKRALRESEQRVRSQFKALPLPTYAWRLVEENAVRDFVLIDYSDAAIALTKGRVAGYIGARASEFFEDLTIVEDLWRALEEGRPVRRELDYRMKATQEHRRIALTSSPALPDMVIVHFEDMTDRLALEDQLRHANKMEAVGKLAGGVAHEFNNLLLVINTCCEFLAEDLGPESRARDDVAEIRRAAERAGDLTRKLLTFSRKQVLQVGTVDLNAAVARSRDVLRRLLGSSIEFSVDAEASDCFARADQGQIEQVLMNLVVNARDSMPNGGSLRVSSYNIELDPARAATHTVAPGKYVVLRVSDNGCGMDEATRARIFEPFFTTKPVGMGTGLGLPTVYAIAKQYKGYVSVESVLGRGTTFEFAVPSAPPAEPTSDGARSSGRWQTSPTTGRILLVEDEPALRGVTRRVLERAGYDVMEASNGCDALEVIATQRPDLVLTDFVMPKMNGRQLQAALAERDPTLPVILMSGYIDPDLLRDDRNGPVALLAKPFEPQQLLKAIAKALRMRRPTRAA